MRRFGIGVCNVLGAIKTAKFYGFGSKDVIVTIAPTPSTATIRSWTTRAGGSVMDEAEATARVHIFHTRHHWIHEGTTEMRRQWHNLKYYTWVEQQGKTVEELDAQRSQEWWVGQQRLIGDIDLKLKAARG
jgi:hypothetical protein